MTYQLWSDIRQFKKGLDWSAQVAPKLYSTPLPLPESRSDGCHKFLKGKESEEALNQCAGVDAKMHHNIPKLLNILKPYLHFLCLVLRLLLFNARGAGGVFW